MSRGLEAGDRSQVKEQGEAFLLPGAAGVGGASEGRAEMMREFGDVVELSPQGTWMNLIL